MEKVIQFFIDMDNFLVIKRHIDRRLYYTENHDQDIYNK